MSTAGLSLITRPRPPSWIPNPMARSYYCFLSNEWLLLLSLLSFDGRWVLVLTTWLSNEQKIQYCTVLYFLREIFYFFTG